MPRTARPVAESVLVRAAAARWVLIAALAPLLAAPSARAGNPCPGENCVVARPQDDILLISTRPLGCSVDETRFAERIYAARYEVVGPPTERRWRQIPLQEALGSIEPATPTVVFAHGNRVEGCEARPRGLWVYSRLVKAGCDERPIRYVIFSWPADQMKGPLRDARTKAARTRPAGLQMAWVINQMPPEAPLGLFGYSFGARVISGATHILAGGTLGGIGLADPTPGAARPLRSVYVAAAFDADWLGPGCYHGRSVEATDSLLIATNQRDPAMRFYGLINRQKHPQALGYAGPTCLTRQNSQRVRLMNVTEPVGATHDMCRYLAVRGFMRSAWRRLTFADVSVPVFARGGDRRQAAR